MARRNKLRAAMQANPKGDWSIEDVVVVCRAYDISCKAPTRGSHYALKHPLVAGRLTIPARNPVKAVYIRLLLDMIDSLESR